MRVGGRELSVWERLYLPEIVRGLRLTLRHFFGRKVTLQYPEERWDPPPAFKGRPVLVEEAGRERCVACGLCAEVCPPIAISMQAAETDDPKERYPEWFEIDMTRCIYCGYCEDVCPEEAIVMSQEYELAGYRRDELIFGKERLLVPLEVVRERLEFLRSLKGTVAAPSGGEEGSRGRAWSTS